MFIHWGLYSIHGKGEWQMWRESIPPREYNQLARQFQPPASFSPEQWVKLAHEAGMKYVVLTTRHHDGFALHESNVNPFNSVNGPARRDYVMEFVKACRKYGLKIGFYYSLMNWQFSATQTGPLADPGGWQEMIDEMFEELRELMSNYGKIDLLWYDGAMVPGGNNAVKYFQSRKLNSMVRSLQPDILINDRSGLKEDFSTPEQEINVPPRGRLWECCMTMNNSWGYRHNDHAFKSLELVAKCLIRCARYGGNLLLNIGPRADGSVPEESQALLHDLGEWLKKCGPAIYRSRRTTYSESNHYAGPVTMVADKVFLHVFHRNSDCIRLDGITAPHSLKLLNSGQRLKAETPGGSTLEIGGFRSPPPENLPETIMVHPAGRISRTAKMLGSCYEISISKGDAPILACEENRLNYALPEGNIIQMTGVPGEQWCPGFQLPVRTGAFTAESPGDGYYNIEIGIIGHSPGNIGAEISGHEFPDQYRIVNPGIPDTLILKKILMEKGPLKIALKSEDSIGIYAIRFVPRWQPLPARHWLCIGPFPTDYEDRKPVQILIDSLNKSWGYDEHPVEGREFTTPEGITRKWQRVSGTLNKIDAAGVDFLAHCQDWGKGICLAATTLNSPREQTVEMAFFCDWWANVYLNGQEVKPQHPAAPGVSGFSTYVVSTVSLKLKKGENQLLVKNHSGRGGSYFQMYLNQSDIT